MNRADKGQSTLEYAFLIVLILSASISMHTYIQRARQGNFKRSAEQIGNGLFYSPRAIEAGSFSTVKQTVKEETSQTPVPFKTSTDWDAKITVSEYEITRTRTTSRDEKIVSLAKEPNG